MTTTETVPGVLEDTRIPRSRTATWTHNGKHFTAQVRTLTWAQEEEAMIRFYSGNPCNIVALANYMFDTCVIEGESTVPMNAQARTAGDPAYWWEAARAIGVMEKAQSFGLVRLLQGREGGGGND